MTGRVLRALRKILKGTTVIIVGFGKLFIGYFLLIFFPLSRIDMLPNLAPIGCLVMFMGLRNLIFHCSENKFFKMAKISLIFLSVLSTAALAIDIAALDNAFGDTANALLIPISNSVYATGIVLFTAFLFIGIYKLALEVELPKLAKKSTIMLSVSVVYLLLEITSTVCSLLFSQGAVALERFTALTAYIGLFAFLFAYLTLFLNLSVLFSCYARICLEGDEDMPYRADSIDKIIEWKNRNKKK